MAGSGIEEVLSVCYASCSVKKMLMGHAYARAVRGHTLVLLSLVKIILFEMEISDAEKEEIEQNLDDFLKGTVTYIEIHSLTNLSKFQEKFCEKIKEIEDRGKTAKLWIAYMKMVILAKSFMKSEKMGDLRIQLRIISQMLPYFHATGHHNYAKSAHLYIQEMKLFMEQMEKRKDAMMFANESDPVLEEYEKFVNDGFCTVRRIDAFWSGNFTDMTIEQDFMRVMKTEGGLIGRGITESTQMKFVLGMPYAHDVCEKIEQFCHVRFTSSEQHIDARDSRINRDNDDVQKIYDFFMDHNPFPFESELKSISNGTIGTEDVNSCDVFEIGKSIVMKLTGLKFHEIKCRKKDNVVNLAAKTSSITIADTITPIDPYMLFQRISVVKKDQELKSFFHYELSPYPLSLFSAGSFRKTMKSKLYELFNPVDYQPDPNKNVFILDGGMLLHRVPWKENELFDDILNRYLAYVKKHFTTNAIVVFDGYENLANSIKGTERMARVNKNLSVDVQFSLNMHSTMSSEKLLSNIHNKKRFIALLTQKLLEENIHVVQDLDDADVLIVQTAINVQEKVPVIVCEDIDVLVILTALAPSEREIFLLKMGRDKIARTVYSSKSLDHMPFCKKNVLFLHALSGCDTTSCFYLKGKNSIFRSFENAGTEVKNAVEVFMQKDQSAISILENGISCILQVYKAQKKIKCLNELRHVIFMKNVVKQKAVNLGSLPPTNDAAIQHCSRVYLQVQKWLSNDLIPEQWGWKKDNILTPIMMTRPAAPDEILKMIFCNCKKGCGNACSCKKAGLFCNDACGSCRSNSCNNQIPVEPEESDYDDIIHNEEENKVD